MAITVFEGPVGGETSNVRRNLMIGGAVLAAVIGGVAIRKYVMRGREMKALAAAARRKKAQKAKKSGKKSTAKKSTAKKTSSGSKAAPTRRQRAA